MYFISFFKATKYIICKIEPLFKYLAGEWGSYDGALDALRYVILYQDKCSLRVRRIDELNLSLLGK